MVMIGDDLAAMVEQMHLQSTLQITAAKTVGLVMKKNAGSRRYSTQKFCGKVIESDA